MLGESEQRNLLKDGLLISDQDSVAGSSFEEPGSFQTVSNSFQALPKVHSPVHYSLIAAANSGSYHERSAGLGSLLNHADVDWEEKSNHEIRQQFYFSVPWSPQVYFTVRGSENFHIYLWIAKDLSWTQGWVIPALVFGIAALLWCLVLCYHAVRSQCQHEMYLVVALVLWLVANFVWMGGEIIDPRFGSRETAGHIMEAAIGWMLLYHFAVKPFNLLRRNQSLDRKYEVAGLHPRFSYFEVRASLQHTHPLTLPNCSELEAV